MKKLLQIALFALLPFLSNAQLQNVGFELWEEPLTARIATGWTRTNGTTQSLSFQNLFWPPVTNAQNGTYAIRLSVWYNYEKDMVFQVAPIASRPAALSGYYTYTDNEDHIWGPVTGGAVTDYAKTTVILTKWNAALSEDVTIGFGELLLGGAEDYTYFNCPITYTSAEVPDTIKVILNCSVIVDPTDNIFGMAELGISSIFTVDNLALSETLGSNDPDRKVVNVYPNPATDIINISGYEGTAVLYDATGKQVLVQEYSGGGIDISRLQQGIYLLKLDEGTKIRNTRIVKQ
jgi:hypothetical protein